MGLNRPFGTLMENMMAQVFKVHPYRWTPIGNIPHLRAAKVRGAAEFLEPLLRAEQRDAGDRRRRRSTRQAQQLARQYLGWIPRADDPGRVTAREPIPRRSHAR